MLWQCCSNVVATPWQCRTPALSQRRRPTSPQLSFSTVPQRCENTVTTTLCQLVRLPPAFPPHSPHSHPPSLHFHPDFLHSHPDSLHSHHVYHSIRLFPIAAFTGGPLDMLMFLFAKDKYYNLKKPYNKPGFFIYFSLILFTVYFLLTKRRLIIGYKKQTLKFSRKVCFFLIFVKSHSLNLNWVPNFWYFLELYLFTWNFASD